RLELSPVLQIRPPSSVLRRVNIMGPEGPTTVFFRPGQRRAREATDGEFCLTKSESGLQIPMNKPAVGEPIRVKKAVLEANTILVKRWWLYGDFDKAAPVLLYGQTWTTPDAGFEPVDDLLFEADGKTRVTAVRVCKEEAIAADNGTVFATGRKPSKD